MYQPVTQSSCSSTCSIFFGQLAAHVKALGGPVPAKASTNAPGLENRPQVCGRGGQGGPNTACVQRVPKRWVNAEVARHGQRWLC